MTFLCASPETDDKLLPDRWGSLLLPGSIGFAVFSLTGMMMAFLGVFLVVSGILEHGS